MVTITKIPIMAITTRNLINVNPAAFCLCISLPDKCLLLISEGVLICNLGICFERLDLSASLRDHKISPLVVIDIYGGVT